jgi:hypothetical protein
MNFHHISTNLNELQSRLNGQYWAIFIYGITIADSQLSLRDGFDLNCQSYEASHCKCRSVWD